MQIIKIYLKIHKIIKQHIHLDHNLAFGYFLVNHALYWGFFELDGYIWTFTIINFFLFYSTNIDLQTSSSYFLVLTL